MAEAADAEKRRFERERQRITCELTVAGARHVGIVTDLSASGLFVQTNVGIEIGSDVVVSIRGEGDEMLALTARVSRQVKPHRGVASIERAGLGLALDSAPEGYYRLLMSLGLG